MFSLSLDVECLVFNDFPDIIVTPFMEEDAGGNLIWKAFAILGHYYDQVLLLAIRIMQVADA
ncbi:hypothetical protein TSUD_381530 [Trifolium subterraneum]|uniref:Uncharacterized protein n=1 Tax=Trifolium subterraneum TaxID=3900 RepID=A0A2Z6LU43_TRISU|nr:hypothetical protein TSUD_381530 [Trifolium subterraneum]